MLAWGFNGLVAFPFGVVADRLGERETLAIMGALVLAVTVASTAAHLALGRRPPQPAGGIYEAAGGD
jgi:hypothetical protein